jgi:hypothetical protein
LSIWDRPGSLWDNATQEVWEAEMAKHDAFTAAVEARGAKVIGGEAVGPDPDGDHAAIRGGQGRFRDGRAVAEVKENLGGFYLIECRDLDEALEIGKLMPMTGGGSLEIRPIVPTGGQ